MSDSCQAPPQNTSRRRAFDFDSLATPPETHLRVTHPPHISTYSFSISVDRPISRPRTAPGSLAHDCRQCTRHPSSPFRTWFVLLGVGSCYSSGFVVVFVGYCSSTDEWDCIESPPGRSRQMPAASKYQALLVWKCIIPCHTASSNGCRKPTTGQKPVPPKDGRNVIRDGFIKTISVVQAESPSVMFEVVIM